MSRRCTTCSKIKPLQDFGRAGPAYSTCATCRAPDEADPGRDARQRAASAELAAALLPVLVVDDERPGRVHHLGDAEKPKSLGELVARSEMDAQAAALGCTLETLMASANPKPQTRVEREVDRIVDEQLPSVLEASRAIGRAMATSSRKG